MDHNNGGSRLGWILGFIVIIVFAAWLLGDAAGRVSNGPGGQLTLTAWGW